MPGTSSDLGLRLASILGTPAEPAALVEYAIDEVTPRAVAKPRNAAEAAEVVRFAIAENLAIIAVGSRSNLGIGMPPSRYDIALDMTAMNQIAHYDPGDLTLSVDAGCTMESISRALAPQTQFLPLSLASGFHSTIAGTIASGVDSHLRQFYGTARDFMVGAEFIDGAGALCKSGGRVVKNVTGYDLHKLLIGSLSTLAMITRLNFRTFPSLSAGESQEMFVAAFSGAHAAVAFRHEIAGSPFTPHAVEILSPELCEMFCGIDPGDWEPPGTPLGSWFSPANWQVVVLFQGVPELRDRYSTALTQFSVSAGGLTSQRMAAPSLVGAGGEARTLSVLVFSALRRIRNASPAATIFRIAQLPAKLPIAQTAQAATTIFELCNAQSATASIQWCPTALKRLIHTFPATRADIPAMRRLKAAFDPRGIFAPGRLV
jgi:FAD/FMN-containing dehydrogenase